MDLATEALAFTTPAEWASWLSAHHATSSGVWLRVGKKNPKRTLITIDEALDVALCHGWIDASARVSTPPPICRGIRRAAPKARGRSSMSIGWRR